jgi:colanic acid biosynthesis glycosyl transferase WcaI
MNDSRAKRILIYGINYAPEPIGVGRYSGELGTYLSARGFDVSVVTAVPHYPGWLVREGYINKYHHEWIGGAQVTRCPLLLKSEMRGIWRLLAPLSFAMASAPLAVWRLITLRPDVLLCVEPTLFSAPVALLVAKIMRVRAVLHVQDLEMDAAFAMGHLGGGPLQKMAMFFERYVLRAFDEVVTISHRMREKLIEKGVAKDQVSVVRNWVDLEKIQPVQGRSTYRAELGLAEGDFVALYSGNIGAKQALPLIFEAAERLADEPDIVFVVAGDGPEKKQLMSRFGHLANLRFLPVQPEERLCDLLNLADVHLLPQDRGAADLVLPSKLGGMLASGKPSIVLADPGTELQEFLGDGAIILPPGDSLVFAEMIEKIVRGAGDIEFGKNDVRIAALDAKLNLPAFEAILMNSKN